MTRTSSIIWSERARKDLLSIKKFFDERNGNSSYSNKLLRVLRDRTLILSDYPFASIKTHAEGIRGLIVFDYIIFFIQESNNIIVVGVWDTRRNPKHLSKFLKRKS
ncbi:MAG: type II toxin-antitoxin system RelE/ParE family toxin [Flavobacteriales bacterium]|nr:type II toxin-antitoxin system RelE/ParE family toxin [Flavobacteriales bacterium]